MRYALCATNKDIGLRAYNDVNVGCATLPCNCPGGPAGRLPPAAGRAAPRSTPCSPAVKGRRTRRRR